MRAQLAVNITSGKNCDMKLRWRMPEIGKEVPEGDSGGSHIPALARAFGHYPITLRPEHERELRAMAALWSTMENNPYYFLANLVSNQGAVVLFLDQLKDSPQRPSSNIHA